ncbi:MAG TPA: alpha/beta fold hydrolase [Vicinamibacterales bacterium]|nr:alpha/beta fold hydrolase [Vicinamibacterales bacterium]
MTDATAGIAPFTTRRWLRNGHSMTMYAWARRRSFGELPASERRLFRVSADTEVAADCFWQPDRSGRPLLLALHGLESSSEAHYMRGLAVQAVRRGWNAVLLNQRNCGGTEHLTPGLYHSGLTADPLAVMKELVDVDGIRDIGVAGYSLGGNLTMRLAGELGESQSLPVRGVVAISPTIDLERCVHAIERPANIPYQWNFMRSLRARMRRKVAAWPGSFDVTPLPRIYTIRTFDETYTAPHHGFAGASDYYFKASAMRVIDRIRIPALILAAEDDPFVPGDQFREAVVTGNPHITVRLEPHGGHCGFISDEPQRQYWAESAAVEFIAYFMRTIELRA